MNCVYLNLKQNFLTLRIQINLQYEQTNFIYAFLLLIGLHQSANSQIMYDTKTIPRPKYKTDLILKIMRKNKALYWKLMIIT